VQGLASKTDCMFKLRQVVGELAEEMVKLSKLTPSPMFDKETHDKGKEG
jgi:hypothetical protein